MANLKVIPFTDTVCLGEEDKMCAYDFRFYSIYEQEGLSKHQDGIVGLGPKQTKHGSKEGPLLINEMKKQGIIDRSLVALFVSKFASKKHSIQIGDYDESFVDGGKSNLHWFTLTIAEKGWRW